MSNKSIHDLLDEAFHCQASDVHISAHAPPTFRIYGQLKQAETENVTPLAAEQMARQLLSEQQWEKLNQQGEIDLSYCVDEQKRYRLNIFSQQGNFSICARLIPGTIPTIAGLGLPSAIQALAEKPHGLILVTGPTGSGKSSTLAALIGYLNEHFHKHIITLEDPIEYLHKSKNCVINQREIGNDTGNFFSGLRSALRQDPDVILVGELRDLETISAAITAAETGHLVLGTLHTINASQTLDRMIDVFPVHQQPQIRSQLSAVLLAVVSQRLLPLRSGEGRKAATELLLNTPAVANLIRSEKTHQIKSVLQTSKAQGMHTLDMSIKELVAQGLVDAAVANHYYQEGGL